MEWKYKLDICKLQAGRVVGNAFNVKNDQALKKVGSLKDCIVLTKEPSFDLVSSIKDLKPLAVLIQGIGELSHGILRFSDLGIPVAQITNLAIPDGVKICIDFGSGTVCPSDENVGISIPLHEIQNTENFSGKLKSIDGELFDVYFTGNTSFQIKKGFSIGLNTIGLIRTEYVLPISNKPPTADMFYSSLLPLLQEANGKTIYLRLADFGGDKCPDWLKDHPGTTVPMGVRGVRVYFSEYGSELLIEQLKAIDKFLIEGHQINLMVPFVSRRSDLENLYRISRKVMKNELQFTPLAETPGACLNVNEFKNMTQKIFLGTNDIMQHFYGANRETSEVADYLSPYSPGLYRLLSLLFSCSQKASIEPVACGQLPSRKYVSRILFGLGFRTFVTSPDDAPAVIDSISTISLKDCQTLAEQVLNFDSREQVVSHLNI